MNDYTQLELIDLVEEVDFEKWKCQTQSDILTAHNLIQKIKDGYNQVHGGIVLDPVYQREYKFTEQKESSIIESLLLEIPIPVIYLSKNLDSEIVNFNVIDGMHRLNSIYRYVTNQYELKGMKILRGLEGRKFLDLPPKIRNKLEFNSQIRIDSIDVSSNPELEYEVFLRFNQDTNPLTRQELYEVLYRSEFSFWFKDYVQTLIEDKRCYHLFRINEKRIKDRSINYMLYVALAYYDMGFIDGRNDTPRYVATYMQRMRSLNSSQLGYQKQKVMNMFKGFFDFCENLSRASGVEYIFSRQFVDKKPPTSMHRFLISYVIPIVLIYGFLDKTGRIPEKTEAKSYLFIYEAMKAGMEKSGFYEYNRASTTGYNIQHKCYTTILEELESKGSPFL
ncbi:DUF262 domain-containing protein [Priestia megaterium]|uniref:DUF262 domain-containing protein n=1 Tax=Priestia megaterium TaxID=1404 RepID=UPI0034D3B8C1